MDKKKKTDDYGIPGAHLMNISIQDNSMEKVRQMDRDIQSIVCRLNEALYGAAGIGMVFNMKFETVAGFRPDKKGPFHHTRLVIESLIKV